MAHWKLTLAYDGTAFHGWQVQPGLATIQGTLARTLHHVTGETVLPQGSGRTDTGVHALAQVASLTLKANIPPANLLRALNRALPPAIRVIEAVHAPARFHARHSALRKTYEYRIFPRVRDPCAPGARAAADRICPPTLAPYAWDCPWHIDLTRANDAARYVLGTHDFTSFASVDPDLTARSAALPGAPTPAQSLSKGLEAGTGDAVSKLRGVPRLASETWDQPSPPARKSALRTLFASEWHPENALLIYRVTGSGFLHHMVRNLAGTFVEAASARLEPDEIPRILAARHRGAAGQTAPARGLFLVSVEYPPLHDLSDPSHAAEREPEEALESVE